MGTPMENYQGYFRLGGTFVARPKTRGGCTCCVAPPTTDIIWDVFVWKGCPSAMTGAALWLADSGDNLHIRD